MLQLEKKKILKKLHICFTVRDKKMLKLPLSHNQISKFQLNCADYFLIILPSNTEILENASSHSQVLILSDFQNINGYCTIEHHSYLPCGNP